MKRAVLFIVLIIISSILRAEEWKSPIDIKYQNKNPNLYIKFDEARHILDGWRGQQEKLLKARQLLIEIIQADNQYAPAYREIGRLNIMAGYINNDNFRPRNLPSAEAAILESIKIEQEYADAYVLLGHLYTKMNRHSDAKTALQKAELIGTKNPWLHLNWADLLNHQGDRDAAIKRYMIVVDEGSENKKAYGSALEGVIAYYIYKREYDKADEWYRKELAYEPENAWAWGNYASFLLFSRNDVDGAIKNSEKALSIMNYGMGRFILSCALYTKWAMMVERKDDLGTRQAIFDRAYRIYPDINSVIDRTSQYQNTKLTSIKLAEHKRKKISEQLGQPNRQ